MPAHTDNQPTLSPTPGPVRRRLRAAVVWTLCATLHLQGLAQTASTLLQEPPFTASEPAPNVMLMFDDSGSMGGHRLPSKHGLPAGAITATGTISGLGPDASNTWTQRSWSINLRYDFALRAPALNPLWYNPAVTYLPWNKDGAPLPAASIGGSTQGVHYGTVDARADAGLLTERDPRSVWNGSAWVSVGAAAGRGLLGTVPSAALDFEPEKGRRVTSTSPAIDFRYHKMPFDFGPAKHADQTWTTHHAVTSSLDLFSRPLTTTPGTTDCRQVAETRDIPRSGCFSSLASCQANQAPVPLTTTTTSWTRQDCQGVPRAHAENPGTLTCWQSRCPAGSNTSLTAARPDTPQTLTCDFQYTDCLGQPQYRSENPGVVQCGWRRLGCDGTFTGLGAVTNGATDPGSLTCWRSRACTTPLAGFSAWTTTDPRVTGRCYRRQTCTGAWEYTPNDRGALSCGYTRETCTPGTVISYAQPPQAEQCYSRARSCANRTLDYFSTNRPATLSCGWERQNCAGVWEPHPRDEPLTCWTVRNCDGTTTAPSLQKPQTVRCPRGDNVPIENEPTPIQRLSREIVLAPQPFTRPINNLGSRSSTEVPLVESTPPRPSIPSGPVTVTRLTQQNFSFTRTATPVNTSQCTSGVTSCVARVTTTRNECTTGPTVTAPNREALTPARYYAYKGSGSYLDPANYTVVQIDRNRPATDTFAVIDATTGAAATRSDCAAKTRCTWPEEARNFANWFLYYRNRMFAAQAVMSDAMSAMNSDSQQQIRLGYGRINHTAGAQDPWRTESAQTVASVPAVDGFTNPGALVRGVRPFIKGTPERSAFFDWLHGQAWAGPTPNREAIDSVGRYFSWTDSRGPWGDTPGTASTTPQVACRRNYAFLTTDGEWTSFNAGQPLLPATGPLAGSGAPGTALRQQGPTITGAGLNTGASFTWKPGDWLQFTGGGNESGTLTDVATYYWNRDLHPDLPNVLSPISTAERSNPAYWQSMSTFIVAYGLTAPMDIPANRDKIALGQQVDWPTVDTSPLIATGGNRVDDSFRAAMTSRGNFFGATSLPELRNGILSTFAQMSYRPGSGGGIAATSPVNGSTTLTFFPSYVAGSWTGSLRAYTHAQLTALGNGGTATPTWTASTKSHDQRLVFTSTDRRAATTFQASSLSTAQRAQLTPTGATAAEVVDWLRGDTRLELTPSGTSGKFRRRAGPLADFVNSAPLFVRAPNYGYAAMPGVGASYAAYVDGRRKGSDQGTVFIGGNGGMLHAFAADTGAERFAYVPRGVYGDLASLASPGYAHRYFVDGQITAGDWHDGTNWRSVVVGTTGAGGASIFALDTTDLASPSFSMVRWDLTRTDNTHIGHIMGRGVVGRIRDTKSSTGFRWVYINGNGYESNSNQAALLVVDLSTGTVESIPVGPAWTSNPKNPAQNAASRNGMGPPTVRYDGQRNIVGVYAGDKQGNLWRFDFSQGMPSGASGFGKSTDPLFTATDSKNTPQPITSAPRLVPHPQGGFYIVFGTGKLIDVEDPTSVAPQAVYGIWERPQQTSKITANEIHTLATTTLTGGKRQFAIQGLDPSKHRGWTLPLTNGERVVADPSIELGLLSIATFRPNSIDDPCSGGGNSNVFRLNLSTGVADIESIPGTVGMITPVLGLTNSNRSLASADFSGSIRQGGSVLGTPQGQTTPAASQCTLYSPSIQGRPTVIATACPQFSPMRVWRQPLR